MRRRWIDRRGLAEIVGTVILVAIVVAAAAAFSLFVATYQSQLQKEEKATHDRSLESIHVTNITETLNGLDLTVRLVSGDINWMNLTGYQVNGDQVSEWNFQPAGGALVTCTWPTTVAGCTELAPMASATATLILNQSLSVSATIQLSVFTGLSNQFSFDFLPPVSIIKVSVLPIGNESVPLFDGSGSYEPEGGDNASITHWGWAFTPVFNNQTGSLTVSGNHPPEDFYPTSPPDPSPTVAHEPAPERCAATVAATALPRPSTANYNVSFTETGLPSGRSWSVTLNGTTNPSTRNTILFSEPDGTYAFATAPVAGYTIDPGSGNVTVNGTDAVVGVGFLQDYNVTFNEHGLTSGSTWRVVVQGTTADHAEFRIGSTVPPNNSTTLAVPNGTYSYWVNFSSILPEPWTYTSPQAEVVNLESSLSSGDYYFVSLTVTNSDGLTRGATIVYET